MVTAAAGVTGKHVAAQDLAARQEREALNVVAPQRLIIIRFAQLVQ